MVAAEDAHQTALRVLRQHMDELHRISAILIERETIDKDQFERLLAGEPEEEPKRQRQPRPRPFPLPGSAMQGPDPAKS